MKNAKYRNRRLETLAKTAEAPTESQNRNQNQNNTHYTGLDGYCLPRSPETDPIGLHHRRQRYPVTRPLDPQPGGRGDVEIATCGDRTKDRSHVGRAARNYHVERHRHGLAVGTYLAGNCAGKQNRHFVGSPIHRVCDVSDLLEPNVAFHGRNVRCPPPPGSCSQETKFAVVVVVESGKCNGDPGRGQGLRTGHYTRTAALRFVEVLADFEGQAQFGELIRHRERAAGLRLDAMQTMPDSVGMTEELCCGIGD